MLRCSWASASSGVPGRRPSLARRLARGAAGRQAGAMRWRWRLVAAVAVLGLTGCTSGEAPEPVPTTAPPVAGDPAWRGLAAVPSERTEVAAAAVGDRVWVLGGYGPDGATLATAEVYDTGADSWDR